MLKKIGHVLLIIAVLTAMGTHWFVLQSVAWTSMLMDNLNSNSVVQAVGRTFDGKHPCRLCNLIGKGKQTEKKSDLRVEWKKFEFSYAPSTFLFSPPSSFCAQVPVQETADLLTHTPPVPPPRAFRA